MQQQNTQCGEVWEARCIPSLEGESIAQGIFEPLLCILMPCIQLGRRISMISSSILCHAPIFNSTTYSRNQFMGKLHIASVTELLPL